MNIALPGLLIILGIIPGIVFWNGYFSGTFSRRFAGISPVLEFAQYVIVALPLDAVGLLVFNRYKGGWSFETLLGFLAGTTSSEAVSTIATTLEETWSEAAVVYLALLAMCFLSAVALRRLVWATRLDAHLHLLRMKNSWYYRLRGRGSGLPRWFIAPYADILVKHPAGESRLYRGLVEDFEVTRDGELQVLALVAADRGENRGENFAWRPIRGDRFIIMGENVHSINMRYVHIDYKTLHPKKSFLRTRLFLRSFFLQEP